MTKQQRAKQLRYDKAYMRMAMEWAKLSYSQRKQVGAIMVKDRMIISDGYNGTPTGFDNCCEDEECSKLIYQSGIKRVVYKEGYRDNEGLAFLEKAGVELVHLEDVSE